MRGLVVTLAAAAGLSAWLLLPAAASAQVSESEPNDTIGTANLVAGAQSVSGVREVEPPDFDYFVFTGLVPGNDYLVSTQNLFVGIGFFADDGTLLDSAAFVPEPEIVATADAGGEFIIGVCGHVAPNLSVIDCSADAVGGGAYLLTVPEPDAPLLGLACWVAVAALRRRRQQGAEEPRTERGACLATEGASSAPC